MADLDISGVNPLNPLNQKMYEKEYKHGANLFKRALDQYTKSDNPFQKAEFQDVMTKALDVLNETANGLMRQELLKQNAQIAQDYATFQKNPGDADTQQKLREDLEKARELIE